MIAYAVTTHALGRCLLDARRFLRNSNHS
jgi:hypothetical protein